MTHRASTWRLTARGWVVLVVLPGAVIAAVAGSWLGRGSVVQPVAARSVVVAPGDSLWAIAVAAAPDRDPRDEIADIARANGLDSSTLRPGQRLRLP